MVIASWRATTRVQVRVFATFVRAGRDNKLTEMPLCDTVPEIYGIGDESYILAISTARYIMYGSI